MSLARRLALMLAFGVFACFAWLQLNDEDSFRWVVVYGLTAGLCLVELAGIGLNVRRWLKALWWVLAAYALAWLLVLLPEAWALGFNMDHEVPRELGGLVIVGVWAAVLPFWPPSQPSASD